MGTDDLHSREWNAVAKAVDVPSLGMFKATLDEALSNLILGVVSLPMAAGLELDDRRGAFQLNRCMIL